jgi:hypothetical protein
MALGNEREHGGCNTRAGVDHLACLLHEMGLAEGIRPSCILLLS